MASPDGKWTAVVRETPPPKREKVFESEFAKRHEDRFKGVQFDWMEFQRDAAPFPLPNAADPDVNPPQEIFLTPSGGAEKQLTHLGLRPAGANWNRDGTTLAFTADSGYRNEMRYGRSDIWTVGVDGRVARLTSGTDFSYAGARYSPDGKWLLATRSTPTDAVIAKKMDHGGPVDIVVFAERRARDQPHGGLGLPPVATVLESRRQVHLFHRRHWRHDSSVPRRADRRRRRAGDDRTAASQRRSATIARSRRWRTRSGRFEAPSDIWVANIDGKGERQLTHVHDAFMSEVALSRAERLNFKSADGTPIEAFLFYPYGYRPNTGPYPLIVAQPRRSAQRQRVRIRFQESVFRGERLLRARGQLPELDRLRREVLVGYVGRVGDEGRAGRDGRRRLRDRELSHRSQRRWRRSAIRTAGS